MASVERLVVYQPQACKEFWSRCTNITTNLNFSNCYSIGWRDTVQGLIALKKQVIIATLSNGNVRLLIDMVIDLLSHSFLKNYLIFLVV